MKSMKKLVLAGLVLLASVVVLAGCKNDSVPEVPKYTVTFDTDGGSAVDSQAVESGKMATKPTDPTLEGSWFLGWYGDKEGIKEFDFSIPITDNTKVYAKWSYKLHSIPQILTDYSSPNNTDSKWTYVALGDWPQTIKAVDVDVDETKSRQMGMFTYYLGSDGNHYVKVTANPYRNDYKYSNKSDVTEGSEVYFKVEPIVWRVLTDDYKVPGEDGEPQSTGKALLLAENILTGGILYYSVDNVKRTIEGAEISPNNYEHSQIRAFLNGLSYAYKESDSTTQFQKNEYEGIGFLQTAFTTDAQGLIKPTTVDNSARSTNPESNATEWNSGKNEYACENTTDKIFLLSEQEATKEAYGFAEYNEDGKGNTRIRVTTDYAKATGAYQSGTAGYGGRWWLRSPGYSDEYLAHWIDAYGRAYNVDVDNKRSGVVPALSISLQ